MGASNNVDWVAKLDSLHLEQQVDGDSPTNACPSMAEYDVVRGLSRMVSEDKTCKPCSETCHTDSKEVETNKFVDWVVVLENVSFHRSSKTGFRKSCGK